MEVVFPCEVEVVVGKGVLLSPTDGKEELWAWLQKKMNHEAQTGKHRLGEARLTIHYKRRTLKQNNLQWKISERIAMHPDVMSTKDQIHDSLKDECYPSRYEEALGRYVKVQGKSLSTVQYAKVCEYFANEAWSIGAQIKDIWILFTEWRWGLKSDPLEGSYSSDQGYRDCHPCCEACCKYLITQDETGSEIHAGELAHIVSKGSGGVDDDWNRLMLCSKHHRGIQHQKGWPDLIAAFPFLWPKVARAHSRQGHAVPCENPMGSGDSKGRELPQGDKDVPVHQEEAKDGSETPSAKTLTATEVLEQQEELKEQFSKMGEVAEKGVDEIAEKILDKMEEKGMMF